MELLLGNTSNLPPSPSQPNPTQPLWASLLANCCYRLRLNTRSLWPALPPLTTIYSSLITHPPFPSFPLRPSAPLPTPIQYTARRSHLSLRRLFRSSAYIVRCRPNSTNQFRPWRPIENIRKEFNRLGRHPSVNSITPVPTPPPADMPAPVNGSAGYNNERAPLLGSRPDTSSRHRDWKAVPGRVAHLTWATLASNYVNVLLVFVPIGIIAGALHWNPTAVFILNFIAIIPLASLLSFATEEISAKLGQTLGGLMNATFGNAVELIVRHCAYHRAHLVGISNMPI